MLSYTFKVYGNVLNEPIYVLVRAKLYVEAVKKLRKRYGKDVVYECKHICPNVCVIID